MGGRPPKSRLQTPQKWVQILQRQGQPPKGGYSPPKLGTAPQKRVQAPPKIPDSLFLRLGFFGSCSQGLLWGERGDGRKGKGLLQDPQPSFSSSSSSSCTFDPTFSLSSLFFLLIPALIFPPHPSSLPSAFLLHPSPGPSSSSSTAPGPFFTLPGARGRTGRSGRRRGTGQEGRRQGKGTRKKKMRKARNNPKRRFSTADSASPAFPEGRGRSATPKSRRGDPPDPLQHAQSPLPPSPNSPAVPPPTRHPFPSPPAIPPLLPASPRGAHPRRPARCPRSSPSR